MRQTFLIIILLNELFLSKIAMASAERAKNLMKKRVKGAFGGFIADKIQYCIFFCILLVSVNPQNAPLRWRGK